MLTILFTCIVIVTSILLYEHGKRVIMKLYLDYRQTQFVGFKILLGNMKDMAHLLSKPLIILEDDLIEKDYTLYTRPEFCFGTDNIVTLFSLENTIKRNEQIQKMFIDEYNKMILQLPINKLGLEEEIEELNKLKDTVTSKEYLFVTVELSLGNDGQRRVLSCFSLRDIKEAIGIMKIRDFAEDNEIVEEVSLS